MLGPGCPKSAPRSSPPGAGYPVGVASSSPPYCKQSHPKSPLSVTATSEAARITWLVGGASVVCAAFVEDLGVAAVVEVADDSTVANLPEAALLEDALHPRIMGEGGAAHGLQVQGLEAVGDEEFYGLAGVAAAAHAPQAYLYADLATLVPEVVQGSQARGLAFGLDDEGLDGRVLPASQVVAPGSGEGEFDRRPPVPGGELGVPVPLVDFLDVLFAGAP